MANKDDKAEKRTTPAQNPALHEDAVRVAPQLNRVLTGMQALALWELAFTADGKAAKWRTVKLKAPDVEGLRSARLISIQSGPRKKDPSWGAKIHLTDEGWVWANDEGFHAALAASKAAAPVFAAFLKLVHGFKTTRGLTLDDILRPKPAPSDANNSAAPTRINAQNGRPPTEAAAAPEALEERIRAAYLRVTGGALNEYVRLAVLRAELRSEQREAVDAELREMQARGVAVLNPIDDPQRIQPDDDAAAMRVLGERRDLFCITR